MELSFVSQNDPFINIIYNQNRFQALNTVTKIKKLYFLSERALLVDYFMVSFFNVLLLGEGLAFGILLALCMGIGLLCLQ